MTERASSARSRNSAASREPGLVDRLAVGALLVLAALLHLRSLGAGFVERDLESIAIALRTSPSALLGGAAFPGGFAPLSRELYWWWWGRVVPLDAFAFHLLNAAIAIATGWLLFRAAEHWNGRRAGLIAGVLWMAFPPLGMLLAQVGGARELVAALAAAAAIASFARGGWLVSALACGVAPLCGIENALLPVVLLVADRKQRPSDSLRSLLLRAAPALALGLTATVFMARALQPVAESSHRAGVLVVPWLFRAWLPAGTAEGFGTVLRTAPWLIVAVAVVAFVAVTAKQAKRLPRSPLLVAGLAVALLSLLSLAASPEAPRAERFAVPALGIALAIAALVADRMPLARAVVVLVAVVSVSANGAMVVDRGAPAFTSASAVRARAAALSPLLNALRVWCPQLRSVPRTFAAGVPPDTAIRLLLDPGARVVCHDPDLSVRFLAELEPEDAARPFGVLRLDPSGAGLRFETADAQVRARVGEGLLVFARHEPAAALFESALAERPNDRELVYPTVAALAAARRTDEARRHWDDALRAGRAPSADSLALRLLAGYPGTDTAGARREVARLAAAVVRDPTSSTAHLELGQELLQLGSARSATLEISVACGIGRRTQDVFWLARGYDAMGARAEALEAYRAALAAGLDSVAYGVARQRFAALLRELGPGALGSFSRP